MRRRATYRFSSLLLPLVLSMSALWPEPALAQTPDWNRQALRILAVPQDSGPLFDVYLVWNARSGPTSAPRNLGAEISWSLNGALLGFSVQLICECTDKIASPCLNPLQKTTGSSPGLYSFNS